MWLLIQVKAQVKLTYFKPLTEINIKANSNFNDINHIIIIENKNTLINQD